MKDELFNKHYKAINDAIWGGKQNQPFKNSDEAAKKSVEITLGYMKDVLEWVKENNYAPATPETWKKVSVKYESHEQWNSSFKSTEEIINLFLTSKQ